MLDALKPFQYFILGCTLAATCVWFFGAQHSWILTGCCLIILIAGLPHGAFDIYIISDLFRAKAFVLAIAAYLALVLATIILWWSSPHLFLTAFLCYSAFHFGDSDWPAACWLHKFSWGLAIITLPCLVAAEEVTLLFSIILNAEPLPLIIQGLGYMAVPSAVATGFRTRAHQSHNPTLALLGCYTLICLQGGALMAFTCYFAFLHGPHHLKRWRLKLPSKQNYMTYLISLIVFMTLVLLALWRTDLITPGPEAALTLADRTSIQYTFVALAALTVPHMTLLFIASKRST